MKSIIYILFVVLFSSFIVSAFPQALSNQKQIVKIQSIESAKPDLLEQSSTVIKKRLNDYGLQNFNVSVNINQNTIEIIFIDKADVNGILPLLISKGKIEFYETYNRLDVIKLLEKGDNLFSTLNIPSENSEIKISPAVLGYCKPGNISQVDSYLTKHQVSISGQDVKFLWSKNSNKNGDYSLYLLKPDAVLDKSMVLESSESETNESNNLMISFNEKGTLVWQNLSKNNIGKPIAIVIDNLVYSSPFLRSEIKEGKCEISGDFTLSEVTLLKSLINNELPLEFKLVK
jgi:preprotein translocase subunit SecD